MMARMLKVHEEVLENKHNLLAESVHIDELLEHMVSRGVVKLREVATFSRNNTNTDEEKTKAFLMHLPKCGIDAFKHLCGALDEIRQSYLAEALMEGVATAEKQEQMVKQLALKTGMKEGYSRDCLVKNGWDYEKSAMDFAAIKHTISPEAFVE